MPPAVLVSVRIAHIIIIIIITIIIIIIKIRVKNAQESNQRLTAPLQQDNELDLNTASKKH